MPASCGRRSPDAMRTLAELRDIRLPPPPDGVDSGLWLAIALLAAMAVLAGTVWARFRPAARARRRIDAAERRWRRDRNPVALAQVLAGAARERLAERDPAVRALAGQAWRDRLELGGLPPVAAEALANWPYRPPTTIDTGPPAVEALLTAVRRWLAARA